MCNEYIDKIDAKATQLVADIADGGKYEISCYPTTTKHIALILENLLLFDEGLAVEVREGLERSLEKQAVYWNGDNPWTNFFISTLYHMIQRDSNGYHDITFVRDEFLTQQKNTEEWIKS